MRGALGFFRDRFGADCLFSSTFCLCSCKAVFVDTDALPAAESRVGDLVQNTIEAELVRQLTETLLQCGVQESQIGIISLYRQQVKVLHHLLQERKGVEILTADKSQGRDKECIIISLVRSNDGGHVRFLFFAKTLAVFVEDVDPRTFADRGLGQGLATHECLVYAREEEARYLWVPEDAAARAAAS
jgi:hypothetical protein